MVDADSTQMAAVASALAGRSFVLQGPPGTGKSQTITNLIAAAVAAGKTVLFVSEKMAALEVVYRRLRQVGLGDFCLELHSHKSNKKEVLESLGRTLERAERHNAAGFSDRSLELGRLRDELNVYATALHRARPLGLTFYQASSRLLGMREIPEVRIPFAGVSKVTEAQLRSWEDAVAEFAPRAAAVSPVASHPFRTSGRAGWSGQAEAELADRIDDALRLLDALDEAERELFAALWCAPATQQSPIVLEALATFATALSAGAVPAAAFDVGAWPAISRRARAFTAAMRVHRARRAALAQRWKPDLFTLDLPPLAERFARFATSFFLFAWIFLLSSRKRLRPVAIGLLPERSTIASDLPLAQECKAAHPILEREMAWVQSSFSAALAHVAVGDIADGDLLALDGLTDRGDAVCSAVSALATTVGGAVEGLRATVSRFAEQAGAGERETLRAKAAAITSLVGALGEKEAAIRALAVVRSGAAWPTAEAATHRSGLRATLASWRDTLGRFRPWCLYQGSVARMNELGLSALVEAQRNGSASAADLPELLRKSFLARWVATVRDEEPALRSFDGKNHHRRTERFAVLDEEYLQLTRQWIVQKLEERLPAFDPSGAASGEPGIVARELRKKTRHLPIRKLFQQIGNLLPRLKPCLLMSPLSIAQYLPASSRRFDLVVFDEASQIGTHDAVGAISRGSQVVIVGDSKQLPPTSFFSRAASDDDAAVDENDVEELESVLDEALARRVPQQMLGWHYRSRHESLIDFSNKHYYDRRLHVFPAAQREVDDLGVKWHPVPEGVYLAGKERTNPREAERLVGHLVETLLRTKPEERSFGVVTFSMAQQSLIEDLLDERRARLPDLEPHFAADHPRGEPVFVKNLENVQGDERDEILFSIGYARDEQGKLRMHFGPLSLAGGERRLNVAITRARCELRVFSTLTHDQIDLCRTNSVGARHLRDFLEYASRQATAAPQSSTALDGDPDRRFEREVCAALTAAGHRVDVDVGCGAYRVDLAVVHPKRPGVYALAVELDGASYRSAHTARDRDRLRRQVLEALGWRVCRVWSGDWWFDPEGEKRRLLDAVGNALKAPPAAPRAVPTLNAAPSPQDVAAAGPAASSSGRVEAPVRHEASAPTVPSKDYVIATVPAASSDPEAFFAPSASGAIQQRILAVVAVEAPVHEELVARRVVACWSIAKLTARVKRRLEEELVALARRKAVDRRGEFVWGALHPSDAYTMFRGPTDERDADMLPPEEVANAAAYVLSRALSLPRDELARETARLFGISRMGAKVTAAIAAGIDVLVARRRCRVDGEMLHSG